MYTAPCRWAKSSRTCTQVVGGLRCLSFDGNVRVKWTEAWSESPMGEQISHESRYFTLDNKKRSIVDEEEPTTQVGLLTICVKSTSSWISCSDCRWQLCCPVGSILKSPHVRVCLSEPFDVIVVTNTWPSLDILDSEVGILGYSRARKDRNSRVGGVAMYINTSIPFSPLQLQHPDLEPIIADCYFSAHLLKIAGFYHPPSSSTDVVFKLHNILSLLRPQNISNLAP